MIYFVITLIISIIAVVMLAALTFFKTSEAFVFFFFAFTIYGVCNILLAFSWSTLFKSNEAIFLVFMGTIIMGAAGTLYVVLVLQSQSPDVTDADVCFFQDW